jgi:hypothetical protein
VGLTTEEQDNWDQQEARIDHTDVTLRS